MYETADLLAYGSTLPAEMFLGNNYLLQTRVIIKVSTHPIFELMADSLTAI